MKDSNKFIDIGFGNLVASGRILCIAGADSSPIRRMIQEARDRSMLIDGCAGKKCRSVIITDSDHIILSSIDTAALKGLLEGDDRV